MTKVKSIKFNFIMNSILTISAMIFPIITYPYVSRILQPEGIGKVSFANSVITYFSMFAQLGIPTYGIRACAKVRDDKEKLSRTVHEILLINFIICILVYLVYGATLCLVPQFRQEKTLFVVMGLLILFNTIGAEWLYKGLEQYSYITVRSVLFKFVAVIAMFCLVHQKEDYIIYGGITIFAAVGSNLLNLINIRKYIYLRPVRGYDFYQHFRPISIFFAMSVATTIYTNMDSVMLGFIRGTTENGYYDAAVKIKNILVGFVASLGTVLLPRVSYYIETGQKQEFDRITQKALKFVFLLASPLCVYFVIFARPSIYLLSGELFENAVLPMQIIMPTLICIGLTNIIGIQMLVPLGREKQVLYSEVAGAVVNIIVNCALIPKCGAAGAAAGTLIAEIVVLLVQVFALRGIVLPNLKKMPYGKLIVSLSISGILSGSLYFFPTGNFLKLFFSAIIFFGVYYILLIVMKESFVLELSNQVLQKLKKR